MGGIGSTDLADPVALAILADRLGNRIGFANLRRLAPRESHLPERAVAFLPALGAAEKTTARWRAGAARPIRLLAPPETVEAMAPVPDDPPVMFRWRRKQHRVRRADGPERIAAEWWQDGTDEPTRDYFRVEDPTGHRFWLFREGLFGRETAAPRWYLHGVFG